jgi:hypothetical protein
LVIRRILVRRWEVDVRKGFASGIWLLALLVGGCGAVHEKTETKWDAASDTKSETITTSVTTPDGATTETATQKVSKGGVSVETKTETTTTKDGKKSVVTWEKRGGEWVRLPSQAEAPAN